MLARRPRHHDSRLHRRLDLADDIRCTEISTLEPERGAWDTFEDEASIDPSQMLQNNRLKARIALILSLP